MLKWSESLHLIFNNCHALNAWKVSHISTIVSVYHIWSVDIFSHIADMLENWCQMASYSVMLVFILYNISSLAHYAYISILQICFHSRIIFFQKHLCVASSMTL